jgi:SAM-dependent methyltransferase
MRIGERLLRRLSRKRGQPDRPGSQPEWTVANALATLENDFPDLDRIITAKRIVDFGCGGGYQTVSLALRGAAFVLGLDTNPRALSDARALARATSPTAPLDFSDRLSPDAAGTFDLVLSLNSMEHFPDPVATLRQMQVALRPGGTILISFGPPWFAPFGAHMSFFTSVPWVNLLFSERTVMRVRSEFRTDGATRYEDVESGLNRMSVAKFERVVQEAGLRRMDTRYRCVRGIQFLRFVPGLRELFVNQVSARLVVQN